MGKSGGPRKASSTSSTGTRCDLLTEHDSARVQRIPVSGLLDFLTVIRCGSINRAATELNISHPALVRRLKHLEDFLTVRLLDRTTAGVNATKYGATLLPYIQEMEDLLSKAMFDLERAQRAGLNNVHFGTTSGLVEAVVPSALQDFTQHWPDISVEYSENTKKYLLDNLRTQHFDFVVLPLPSHEFDSDFVHEELFADNLLLVVRPEHPLANRHSFTLADVMPYQWVLPSQSTQWRERFKQIFRQKGFELPTPAFETVTFHVIKSLILNSDRIAILPSVVILDELKRRALIAIDGETSMVFATYSIVYRKDFALSPAAKKMVHSLREAVKILKLKKRADFTGGVEL
jgi:DNA-binding transcriptional LysR family regulator